MSRKFAVGRCLLVKLAILGVIAWGALGAWWWEQPGPAQSSPRSSPELQDKPRSQRSQDEPRRAQEQPAKLPNDTFLENLVFAIWLRLLASGAP